MASDGLAAGFAVLLFIFLAALSVKLCRDNKRVIRSRVRKILDSVPSMKDAGVSIRSSFSFTCASCNRGLWQKRLMWAATSICTISFVWEFIRLYYLELAKKMSIIGKGVPSDCVSTDDDYQYMQRIRSWLLWSFSWYEPRYECEQYHQAVVVHPILEVNPLKVVVSLLCHLILEPCRLILTFIGELFHRAFSVTPVQWQVAVVLLLFLAAIFTLLIVCRYKIHVPFILQISPAAQRLRNVYGSDLCTNCTNNNTRQPRQQRPTVSTGTRHTHMEAKCNTSKRPVPLHSARK